ncbi:unnamed protein product, partial [marine sediment metagenome]
MSVDSFRFSVIIHCKSVCNSPYISSINPNLLHITHYYSNAKSIIKNKIDAELAKGAKIVVTVDSRNSDANTTTITGTIENVSTSTLNNLEINGMVFKERQTVNLKYSVFDIFEEQKVPVDFLAPGNIVEFSFTLEDFDWETDNVHGVIFV